MENMQLSTGCWVDGRWGQYGIERLLSIAKEFGWSVSGDIEVNDLDRLSDLADEAEEWMNNRVAPKGCSFGWYNSEFFLMPY